MKRKLFSLLLVLAMIIGIMPFSAIAEDNSAGQTERYGDFTSGEQVISNMVEKGGMYAHPRIIMTEDKFAKLKNHIGDDSVTAVLLEKLEWYGD